MIYARLNENKS